MVNVRELKEFEEWDNQRSSTWTNFKKSLTPIHMIALVALAIFGYYLINQAQSTSNQKTFVIGGIVVVVIVLILRGQLGKQKEPIPEDKIKAISEQLMKRKIGNEYPFGTVILPTLYCSLRFQGEWGQAFAPWKWEVGFRILYPDYKYEEVVVVLHCYEGYITRIKKVPAGYSGDDSNDVKVLLPTQFAIQSTVPKEAPKG